MKRTILSLTFLIGLYHVSSQALDKPAMSVKKEQAQEITLEKSLHKVLSKTNRFKSFHMAEAKLD